MNLIEVTKKFADKQACLDYLAQMRWPNGITCLKCGVIGDEQFRKFTTNETTRKRFSVKKQKVVTVKVPSRSLYECKGCGYQFAATTGTVFHDTHLDLTKWFMAIALILEGKEGCERVADWPQSWNQRSELSYRVASLPSHPRGDERNRIAQRNR